MLKNPSHSYQDNYDNSKMKMPMSDKSIEQYIQIFFANSPRANSGTAPAFEWLEFLNLFNEHENFYMLTEVQKKAIMPYCELNQDLEMTPEEFISLVHLIRHNEQKYDSPITPHISASTPVRSSYNSVRARKLLDSRPRSSKILSSNRSFSYYDDRTSVNHPDAISTTSMDDRVNRSAFMEEQNNEYDNQLKRERNILRKQLRDYDARMSQISKEHADRTERLKADIENLKFELDQQRVTITEQKHRERDRLEKITELKAIIHNLELKNEALLKKLQKKDEENEQLKEKIASLEESQAITESNIKTTENDLTQAREIIRGHEKVKADLHMELEQRKVQNEGLTQEIEAQKQENIKLMEIIDRQKFDLDEARSGLRIYSNTPVMDKKSENDQEDASLAEEQIEAKYSKKLQHLEDERNSLNEKLSSAEAKLSKAEQVVTHGMKIQKLQKENIDRLSLKFDKQLEVVNEIQSKITNNSIVKPYKWFSIVSAIPWIVFIYQIYIFIISIFNPEFHQRQPSILLQYLDELMYVNTR